MDLQHLALVEGERARCARDATRVRLATLALEVGFVVLHAGATWPRYMFIAPLVAVAGWAVEAQVNRRAEALGLLAGAVRGDWGPRPARLSLDAEAWVDQTSLRRAVFKPATALLYHPAALIGAMVAVDAQNVRGGEWPAEPYWYAALAALGSLALVMVFASWLMDRRREAPPRAMAMPAPQPMTEPAAPPALREPALPFPDAPRMSIEELRRDREKAREREREPAPMGERKSEPTQTFGSVQLPTE
ncbi:MAG: hypothetical protein R3A52_07405 [Polyangiales bacterium]